MTPDFFLALKLAVLTSIFSVPGYWFYLVVINPNDWSYCKDFLYIMRELHKESKGQFYLHTFTVIVVTFLIIRGIIGLSLIHI